MPESIYKQAIRSKLRFQYRGQISTEDLWSLPLPALDAIYKVLNAEIKQSKEDSLLVIVSKDTAELDLKIAIIKDVVATKQEAKKAAEEESKLRAEKVKIMTALANKQEDAIQNMNEDELAQKLAEINTKLEK